MISAVFTTIYACKKLSKPGISEEIRQLVLKRHVVAILTYTITFLYIPATAIVVVMNFAKEAGPDGNKWWKVFLKLLYFS